MAYVSANLNKIVDTVGNEGPALWTAYGVDVDSDYNAADFVSDGDAKGLKLGDFVFYHDTTNDVGSVLMCGAVTAGGAATTQFAVVS